MRAYNGMKFAAIKLDIYIFAAEYSMMKPTKIN